MGDDRVHTDFVAKPKQSPNQNKASKTGKVNHRIFEPQPQFRRLAIVKQDKP